MILTNVHGQLDQSPSADVNSKYDIVLNKIYRVVEKHISSKTVKFNKYKNNNSKWITYSTGIIRFFTKQIATEGFSTVFGQSRCAL